MSTERRNLGFYWVKHESDDFYEVAYWDGKYFLMAMDGRRANEEFMFNIKETPIEPPTE